MFTKQELFTLRTLVRAAVGTGDPQTPEVGMIMAKITGMIARTPNDAKLGTWAFKFNEEQDKSGAMIQPRAMLTRTMPDVTPDIDDVMVRIRQVEERAMRTSNIVLMLVQRAAEKGDAEAIDIIAALRGGK